MNSSDSLVSVIVTSYNYAGYIGQTINSILSQTHKHCELIICDDCSSDNSLDIIRSFHDSRITLIVSERNQGACAAYNRAYAFCKGRYISCIDSDDYIAPDKFEKQVKFMESHPDIDICGTFISEVDEEGKPIHSIHEEWFNCTIDLSEPSSWVLQNRLCHSSVIMKKTVHDSVGEFNDDLIYSPDYEFWTRCLTKDAKFHVMTDKLTYYRYHGENITHKDPSRKYWETVYIYSRFLFPYLMKINRPDLVIKAIKNMIWRDGYSLNVSEKDCVISLLLDYSREFQNFDDMMKYVSSSATGAYSQPRSVWQTSLRNLLKSIGEKLTSPNSVLPPEVELNEIATELALTKRLGTSVHDAKDLDFNAGTFCAEANIDVVSKLLWLEIQRSAWEDTATERERTIAELQAQAQDLQTGNVWLTSQRDVWEKVATERERTISELQAQAQDLQTGNAWLTSQRDAWEKVATERERAVADLTARLQQTDGRLAAMDAVLNKMRNHWGIRFITKFSKTKFS